MKAVISPLAPRDAIAALEARGGELPGSFSWQDVWQEEHAHAFTVAKSVGYDILSDIHGELMKALADGRTFRQFAAELRPLLERKGWWGRRLATDPSTGEVQPVTLGSMRRLRTIFDVNMRVSYAAGHWAMFERHKAARPHLRYVHVDPELHQPDSRPHHAAMHNLVLPVDHPHWNVWAPPNGWGCRCTLQQLSQRDVDRLVAQGEDLAFEPPVVGERPWTNRRTGEITIVPDGIDPGWAYNPGMTGHAAAARSLQRKMERGLLFDLPPTWPKPARSKAEADAMAGRLNEAQEDWADSLHPHEIEAIASYKGSGHAAINGVLRDDESVTDELDDEDFEVAHANIADLSAALARARAPWPLTLVRGVPPERADAYRNVRFNSIVADDGFFSASLSDEIARKFGDFTIEVRVPAGVRGVALVHSIPDVNHVEYEVLLAAGTRMRVVEVLQNRLVVEVLKRGS